MTPDEPTAPTASSSGPTTWEYRVMVSSQPTGGDDFEECFELIEAYYEGDSETVVMWADPKDTHSFGNTIEELRDDLNLMLRALEKPAINDFDLPRSDG